MSLTQAEIETAIANETKKDKQAAAERDKRALAERAAAKDSDVNDDDDGQEDKEAWDDVEPDDDDIAAKLKRKPPKALRCMLCMRVSHKVKLVVRLDQHLQKSHRLKPSTLQYAQYMRQARAEADNQTTGGDTDPLHLILTDFQQWLQSPGAAYKKTAPAKAIVSSVRRLLCDILKCRTYHLSILSDLGGLLEQYEPGYGNRKPLAPSTICCTIAAVDKFVKFLQLNDHYL